MKNSIQAKADKAENLAAKELKAVVKDALKEIKVLTKDWMSQAGEVDDINDEKVDEIKELGKDIKNDFYTAVRETRKENAAAILDLRSTPCRISLKNH